MNTVTYVQSLFQKALHLHQTGHIKDVETLYNEILQKQPDHEEATHLLGLVKFQKGDYQEAIALITRAVEIDPSFAAAHYNLGRCYEEIGENEKAVQSYNTSLSLRPDDADCYLGLGNVQLRLLQLEEALGNFEKAIVLKPKFAEAHNNLGKTLKELERPDEALASYEKAIAFNPRFVDAHNNRGHTLRDLGRLEEAVASYDAVIRLKPDHAEAYGNRGNALKKLKWLDEAVASYDKAIELKPDDAESYRNRANVLSELNRLDEAVDSYNKALELKPGIDFLIGRRLFAEMSLCDWTIVDSERERLSQQIEAGQRVCVPFTSAALFDSPALQRKSAEIYAESLGISPSEFSPIPALPNDRIRIGYFSADFREHPVSFLTADIFELHDRERFEITAFSFYEQKSDDEMRRRLRNAFDSFVDVTDKSNEETANLSRKLKIDIAVDLTGYTKHCRPQIFGFRAAPIQVSYIGYLGTMGTAAMDYLISDQVIVPKDSEVNYSEKIVRLPCYQVNDSKRPISERVFSKEELGIAGDAFVFCCFNNNYKISPEVFSSWMRILKSTGNSVLLLYLGNKKVEENLRREAQVRGVEPGRLVFAEKLPRDEYIARFRCADLFLDTLPYNAGTTASDALWAGLPVLTCLGKAFAGRVCASILASIGLSDLITHTPGEYEALATELATQPHKLEEIRDKLKANRRTSRLFDSRRFTKNIEAAYTAMIERYTNDLPPDHIHIEENDGPSNGY
ncbi:MAG TPA: tetratricopeptide repeat protein [Aestuariivirga sp.]|nr:tetratricopeptide repeat protein [Aestuariivirga sp.]